MAAFRRPTTIALALTGIALSLAVTGCGGRPEPRSLPPQTLVEGPSEEGQTAAPPPEPLEAEEQKVETLIVLEESVPIAAAPSLVQAAAAEKRRRASATDSNLKLTDKNLDRYAVGELTTSDPDPLPSRQITITGQPQAPTDSTASDLTSDPTEIPDGSTNEGYWRNRVLDIRLRWRAAYDSIQELEGKVAGLRNDFYSTDDPYYRDSQIKPAWDRALESLETARSDIDRYQAELKSVLDEGRREGAMPGWLREGIEHQPATGQPLEETVDPSNYSVQPSIYDEGGNS